MTFKLSARSKERLKGVHPDLVRVVKRAITLTTVDFTVVEGVRSQKRQNELYAQGRTKPGPIVTWTQNSNHTPKADGFGHAVDLAPFVEGKIDWNNWRNFEAIEEAMRRAAEVEGVAIVWGGSWKKPDGPHFELKQ